ncbi:MAG: TonB-dependent receptor domain-containing protein [Phocaeicola sp.]
MRELGIKKFFVLIALLMTTVIAQAAAIRGVVTDKSNQEPLIGATVQVNGTTTGTITDFDGQFELAGLRNGTYTLIVQYVSYITKTLEVTVNGIADIVIELDPDNQTLGEVVVTGTARKNTENAILNQQRTSLVMQTGVSSQHIARTQDKDASEVIRRVPGISIIDEKFVMVRGLSQRYNNVWINNSAVPSSEPDSRAFSFDIIPSSQLDNMVVVKSPSPEYPSDFSGGFVLVNTKDVPSNNMFSISLGGSVNDQTHMKDFQYNKGSGTDFLGFDNGFRGLNNGIHTTLNPIAGNGIDLQNNGFNNDWSVKNFKPLADMSLSMNVAQRWVSDSGRTFALLGAANYSSSYKTLRNMENALFGAYDEANEKSTYLHNYKDNQYNQNVRIGAMLNLTYVPASGNSRYEFKNIFNQLARDRYTFRQGTDDQANRTESAEYYYNSRTTYNGQFTGKHTLADESKLDWSGGYAYANQNMPDRRRYLVNDALEPGSLGLERANDINREFTKLEEHILSANANYEKHFEFGSFNPSLKAGVYSEYRTREYNARLFNYNFNSGTNTLPSGFRYMNIPNELLQEQYYGENGLYLLEDVNWINNYKGNNLLAAGYVGTNLPFGKLNVYAGVRFEHSNMELITNTRRNQKSPKSHNYTYNDFFPSINAAYKMNDKHQFRLSYGRTTNRPELRELSPSVFYDFDLSSDVQGNVNLQAAYINNFDLGYEFYPSSGELISVSLFYKQFKNPIEWTYTVAGGTGLIYSFTNAEGANNYGIELDIRKNLDFLGLRNFSWSFNGALIKSEVTFAEGAMEQDRPMQGQSPYLINTGIFYQNPDKGWNMAVLYNRIGKRIIGVGRSVGTGDQVRIPDSYEMPRNSIDLSVSKKFGNKLEVKAAVRDILAEKVSFKQFAETSKGEVEQITRQYKPGRTFNLNVNYTF